MAVNRIMPMTAIEYNGYIGERIERIRIRGGFPPYNLFL